jgi:hypothetical protein
MAENISYLLLYIFGGIVGIFFLLALTVDFLPDFYRSLKTPDYSLVLGGTVLGFALLAVILWRALLVIP